jgi:hypothetical protein
MELGNMCFGISRGSFQIPRNSGYEGPLDTLLGEMGVSSYGEDFENDTFEMHPYYWGDCTCGYAEKEHAWCEAHPHSPKCYQTQYNAFWRVVYDNKKVTYDEARAKVDKFAKNLCKRRGIPWNDGKGSAVHCDCGHEEAWIEWSSSHDHDPKCPIVRPNFLHKKSGLSVMWYKYPLRDSYANREIAADDWRRIMLNCIASLKK